MPSPEDEDFNWNDVADNVVQHAVEKVAIFTNPNGDVVVRQERRWDEEHDSYIIIAGGNALLAAYKILEAAGLGDIQFHRFSPAGGCYVDVSVEAQVSMPEPEALSNAARERRYRQRRHNEERNDDEVTGVTQDATLPLLDAAE